MRALDSCASLKAASPDPFDGAANIGEQCAHHSIPEGGGRSLDKFRTARGSASLRRKISVPRASATAIKTYSSRSASSISASTVCVLAARS